jgi:HEAT repeat protein
LLATLKKLPKAIGGNPKLEKFVLGQGEARAEATIWAFKALGTESRPFVPELFDLAHSSKNPAVSRRAQAALDILGADALLPLLAAVASGKIKDRADAISWLAAMHRLGLNARPGHGLQVSHPSLAGTNASLAVQVLLRCVEDKDLGVVTAAIRGLGVLHYEAGIVVPALARRLEDPRTSVRVQAAVSLSYFHEQALPAVPALRRALLDADDLVRYQATNSLQNITPDLFPRRVRNSPLAWE